MTSGESYRLLYEISARNLFDGYEEYIRTEVSLLTVFSNSFSLWLSIFSGFKLVFGFIYENNFNNYKVLQKILSKVDKVNKNEKNHIELSSDFSESNNLDKLIETQEGKNIVINDDSLEKII